MTEPDPIQHIRLRLRKESDAQRAKVSRRYFQTGPGQYAEGDRFYGVRVPVLRKLAAQYRNLPVDRAVFSLLRSGMHEERHLAVLILVEKFRRADDAGRRKIFRFYIDNTDRINNWDLVDSSAPPIVGGWLFERDTAPLFRLARSASLWDRRIAVMATFTFIRQEQYAETLRIAEQLLQDPEDLIHKAVGWMLREIGKRNLDVECRFLHKHCRDMPRTILRYAVEKFPPPLRRRYLSGEVD